MKAFSLDEPEPPKKAYLVVIRLAGDDNAKARIMSSGPAIKATIERISAGACALAFNSADGGTFGWLLQSAKLAHEILRELQGNAGPQHGTSPTMTDDSLLILEVGPDYSGYGLSRAWTWLQRRAST